MKRVSAGSTGHGRAGPDRHQARSRLPPHSRIHLFVRRGLSEGWDLCLSDHAEIGYGVLPGLPQRPVAKVCQAGYPLDSRRRPKPSLPRPRAPRQYLAALPAAILAGAQPEGKSLGGNPRKIFKNYALKSLDAVRAKLKQAILYIERNPKIVKSITSFPYIRKSF